MNSLSWFIYLADVVPTLGTAMCVIGTVSLGAGVFLVTTYFAELDYIRKYPGDKTEHKAIARALRNWAIAGFLFGLLLPLGLLVPHTKTFYLIAASELGEQVATHQVTQEVARDVYDIIRSHLGTLKKD